MLRFTPRDTTALSITFGTDLPATTRRRLIVLRGTAADNTSLAHVEIKRGKKPFRSATGLATRRFRAPLAPGRNVFKVRARDAANNVSPVIRLRLTRVP